MPSKAQARVFLESGTESAYESIASLEPANHEFESYTRVLANSNPLNTPHSSTINSTVNPRPLSNAIKSYSVDYGFDAINSASPTISTTTGASSSISDSTAHHRLLLRQQQVKHSTLNSQAAGPANSNSAANNSTDLLLMYNENLRQIQKNDSDLYEKILAKLSRSSIDAPAHVPLLCICTFNLNETRWIKLISRLSALGINVRLIEIVKGVPVNALFYLSNLDLIYVRTADELEGYVPKDCCKPISCSINISSSNASSQDVSINNTNNNNNTTTGLNTTVAKSSNYTENMGGGSSSDFNFIPIQNQFVKNNDDHDSIKYHSLSSSEYDDLIEPSEGDGQSNGNAASNIPAVNSSSQINYSMYKTQDSGYRSEFESRQHQSPSKTNNQLDRRNFSSSNENSSCLSSSNETKSGGDYKSPKLLLSLPSRSRLPISVSSNMNLTLMDPPVTTNNPGEYFANHTYKSQPSPLRVYGTPSFSSSSAHSSEFQRAKSSRRSLDSSVGVRHHSDQNGSSVVVANLASKFFAVPIDLNEEAKGQAQHRCSTNDEQFSELDLKRIELDSLIGDNSSSGDTSGSSKLWTVILRHEARNFQEISVSPGMLVSIIRTFNEWIYVKLIGFENTNMDLSQQYVFGILPKSCVADLNEVILNSQQQQHNAVAAAEYNAAKACFFLNKNRRKSSQQITAL